ncbi:unnamed protein product [Candida verbasci]|uniref:Uncharacterized protein n=1 Tax=Candida verbasci TaxID=1227364 RepID=A0A9W4XL33_9ASCO|nr:unnamed protein product [Candida verbasci]
MSGSSRSLIKALDTLFAEWGNSDNTHEDIDSIIQQYLNKHNELSIIQQATNLNDELYKIYNNYIKPSENIEQEYKFLDILKQVSLVFNQEEINLWLQTYLKPAVDSAGFDLKFVEKSRQFIEYLTGGYTKSNDEKVNSFRSNIAKSIIDQIINIYLQDSLKHEKLKIDAENKDSQVYHERIRFIKSNCIKLLDACGIQDTLNYYQLLNEHILIPKQRHETLILVSSLVGSRKASLLIKTDLFSSLLKCVVYEFDDAIVYSSLTIINMLIPQVTNDLSLYVPDLFAIYSSLICWNDFNKNNNRIEFFDEYAKTNWKMAASEKDSASTSLLFDYQHLMTYLYGLYYYNVLEFIKDPFKYFRNHPPKLIPMTFVEVLEKKLHLGSRIIDKTKNLVSTFLIHPKVFNSNNPNELDDPTSWIDGNSPEDIAAACLSLNSDILTSTNKKEFIIEPGSDVESQKLSRNSSMAGPMYINVTDGLQAKLHNIQNRKMSIIPTNIVIESAPIPTTSEKNFITPVSSEIKFKDVKFNEGIISENEVKNVNSLDSIPSSPELFHHEPKMDPISDLLSTHEKLFGATNKNYHDTTSSHDSKSSLINEKLKHELRLSRPMSSPTTNIETSSVFKDVNDSKGNVVVFYQRELLLFKNELEFSNYMKYLYQYYFFKNKREKNMTSSIKESDEFEEMQKIVDLTRRELDTKLNEFKKEKNLLLNKLQQLEQEKEEVKKEIDKLNDNKMIDTKNIQRLMEEVSLKDYEIEKLKLKINDLTTVKEEPKKPEVKVIKEPADDKTIYELRSQVHLITERYNEALAQLANEKKQQDELIKKYEQEIKQSKYNIDENITQFTSKYEKKIQELSTIILKYETLLEEKNSRILRLSSSKPIPIGTNNTSSTNSRMSSRSDSYDHISESYSPPNGNSYNPHIMPSPAPIQFYQPKYTRNNSASNSGNNSTSSNVPIMRGRGGIQKRSKKMM